MLYKSDLGNLSTQSAFLYYKPVHATQTQDAQPQFLYVENGLSSEHLLKLKRQVPPMLFADRIVSSPTSAP